MTDPICPHKNFESQAIINRLEDTGLFAMDLKTWCADCALPFEFPETIQIGLDLHGIARSVDGQELRVAIKPATRPDVWSDNIL